MEMKPISDMTLIELDNEIVELQYKQMAYEWDDNAPAFTYADWVRLLALRGECENRVDDMEA